MLNPGMGMSDPVPTFSYIIRKLAEKHPNLAFVDVREPRVKGDFDLTLPKGEVGNFEISYNGCNS